MIVVFCPSCSGFKDVKKGIETDFYCEACETCFNITEAETEDVPY